MWCKSISDRGLLGLGVANWLNSPLDHFKVKAPTFAFDVAVWNLLGRCNIYSLLEPYPLSNRKSDILHFCAVFCHFEVLYLNRLQEIKPEWLQFCLTSKDFCDAKLRCLWVFVGIPWRWRASEFACFAIKHEVILTQMYFVQSSHKILMLDKSPGLSTSTHPYWVLQHHPLTTGSQPYATNIIWFTWNLQCVVSTWSAETWPIFSGWGV